jgi:hypothetical protein
MTHFNCEQIIFAVCSLNVIIPVEVKNTAAQTETILKERK